jgi:hypothetical protein
MGPVRVADCADDADFADCSDVGQDLQLKACLGSAVPKSFAVQLLLFFLKCVELQFRTDDSELRAVPFESAAFAYSASSAILPEPQPYDAPRQ